VSIRFRLGVVVQLGAVTSSVLADRAGEVGAAPLEVPVPGWDDPAALEALRSDADRAGDAVDGLADRIETHGAPPPEVVPSSALLDLARERVGEERPGAPLVDLVRLGAGLQRIAVVAGGTPGVRHGRAVTRVA
jgi:hypothetical protein